jgi:hypothetical protein
MSDAAAPRIDIMGVGTKVFHQRTTSWNMTLPYCELEWRHLSLGWEIHLSAKALYPQATRLDLSVACHPMQGTLTIVEAGCIDWYQYCIQYRDADVAMTISGSIVQGIEPCLSWVNKIKVKNLSAVRFIKSPAEAYLRMASGVIVSSIMSEHGVAYSFLIEVCGGLYAWYTVLVHKKRWSTVLL